jgi:hypothetical protein
MEENRKKRKVKDENFFVIFGWMTSPYRMNLSGLELQIYALIFGMSQGDDQYYSASHKYAAEFCGCHEDHVKKVLRSLTEKGFLLKEQTGYNAYRYKAKTYDQLLDEDNPYIGHDPTDDENKDGGKMPPDGGKMSPHGGKMPPHGGKMPPDIKSIKNNINNIYNARARAIPQKRAPDKSKNNKFMNFDQRDNIDYKLLEEKLVNKST